MPLSYRKHVSALLRGITSKNNGDFYCLNCLHSLRIKNILGLHKKVCKNKDFLQKLSLQLSLQKSWFSQTKKKLHQERF